MEVLVGYKCPAGDHTITNVNCIVWAKEKHEVIARPLCWTHKLELEPVFEEKTTAHSANG